MANNRLSVNCLVQVTTDNRLDFEEWLNYHIALGFDTIYVCDSGNRAWLDELCAKKGDRVVLAPRDERWQYKSDMISDYVSRRTHEEWCVCLDDHDFIWISPARANSIVEYVDMVPRTVAAVTFYVKHISSKEPTRYRVGTQIDCFTHTRREPEGFRPPYETLPNTGVTMFRVTDRSMPLRDPVTPVYANAWCDSEFRQMSLARFKEETASQRFYPTSYSVRIYRYAIRSGVEMNFDDKMVPVGFNVPDLNMQKAREQYLHIPVNPNTETLFAKKEAPIPDTAECRSMVENQAKIAAEINSEQGLPLSRARIDKLIFKGQFYEDVLKYAESKDPNVDRDLLYRVFDEERKNIIATSTLYVTLQELIDQGKDDNEIRRTLCVGETTLQTMKKALPVLDIKTEYAQPDSFDEEDGTAIPVNFGPVPEPVPAGNAAEGTEDSPIQTEDTGMPDGVVEGFEEALSETLPTEEELAIRKETLEKMDVKEKPKKGAKGTKKAPAAKKPKAKAVAGSAKKVDAPAVERPAAEAVESDEPVLDTEDAGSSEMASLDDIPDSMLAEIDLDAVAKNVLAAPSDGN